MKKIALFSSTIMSLSLLVLGISQTVYGMSSVIRDLKGDGAPGYQDIIGAKVTEQNGKDILFLSMEVASPVSKQPSENALYWSWDLDTDPNSAPYGSPADFVAHVHWNGDTFVGFLYNRITTVTTTIPFSIDGVSIKAFVDISLIGDPSSFSWIALTKVQPGIPDFAPDTGWTTWHRQ